MKLNSRRSCVGPRGGRVILPTPCGECVAWRVCRSSGVTAELGCDSWVGLEGHRVDPAEDARRVLEGEGVDAVDDLDRELEEPAPSVVAAGFDPEGSGPVLVPYFDPPAAFDPAELGEGQGVLPMPDAGPLFGKVKP